MVKKKKRRVKKKKKKSQDVQPVEEVDLNGLSDLEELGLMAKDISSLDEEVDKALEKAFDEEPDEVFEEVHDEAFDEVLDEVIDGSPDETPVEVLDEALDVSHDEAPDEALDEVLDEVIDGSPDETPDEVLDEVLDESLDVSHDEALDDVLDEVIDEAPDESHDETSQIIPDAINSFEMCGVCGGQLINGECLNCAKRIELERKLFDEDQEGFKEDQYREWKSEMRSKGELNLFGIFCIVVASIYLIYISFPPVLELLTGDFILEEFLLNFVLLIFGVGALSGGFVMARHVIIYGRLFDTTFEKEIYSRLEPAFAEVGNVKGDIQEINERMDRMTIHLKRLEIETRTATQISSVSAHSSSALRYMALMIISLGVFFFVLRYPDFYLPYAFGALFMAWWAGITSDFTLWKINVSWTWAFFAIVFVIPASILIDVIYGLRVVIGIMGIALSLFAFSYYTWAKYYVEGTTPSILPVLGDEE
jgi:hypothetical protein